MVKRITNFQGRGPTSQLLQNYRTKVSWWGELKLARYSIHSSIIDKLSWGDILKGIVSRDFLTSFFHDSYTFGPRIHILKYFRIWTRFRSYFLAILKLNKHWTDSAVWMTPRSSSLRCHLSTVKFITPRYKWHQGITRANFLFEYLC